MILLMSATANTALSFLCGFGIGGFLIAWWYGRESQKYEETIPKEETKIIRISDDIERSIIDPNVPDWKKAENN